MISKTFLVILAILTQFVVTGLVRADCLEQFPDSRVSTRLAKPAYTDCIVTIMADDYSRLLNDQTQSLKRLKNAYHRMLQKEVDETTLTDSALEMYLNNIQSLQLNAIYIQREVGILKSDSADDFDTESANRAYIELSRLLIQGQKRSQTLIDDVMRTLEWLDDNEKSTYCQLDFYFRIGKELEQKIEVCISGR